MLNWVFVVQFCPELLVLSVLLSVNAFPDLWLVLEDFVIDFEVLRGFFNFIFILS